MTVPRRFFVWFPVLLSISPSLHLSDEAFVTLATNDNYARGAMVLGKSLRNHNTSKQLVALIGPQVSEPCQ